MDEENKIIEIDININLDDILPLNLNDISPEVLLDLLGLSNLTFEELLTLLKKGAFEIKEAWKTKLYHIPPDGMQKFHAIGKKYSPIAFKTYDLLRKEKKEPRMTIYVISQRAITSACLPDTVIFSNNSDVIYGLFKALEKDGYYASTTGS
jgi:hypothetical protein